MSTYKGKTVTVLEQIGLTGSAASTATVVADIATVAADIAVLVADGATPTQGHVTTLNTDWTTFNTDWSAYLTASGGALTGNALDKSRIDSIIRFSDGSQNKVKASEIT